MSDSKSATWECRRGGSAPGENQGSVRAKRPRTFGEKGEEERILHEGPEALGQHWGLWLGALDMI